MFTENVAQRLLWSESVSAKPQKKKKNTERKGRENSTFSAFGVTVSLTFSFWATKVVVKLQNSHRSLAAGCWFVALGAQRRSVTRAHTKKRKEREKEKEKKGLRRQRGKQIRTGSLAGARTRAESYTPHSSKGRKQEGTVTRFPDTRAKKRRCHAVVHTAPSTHCCAQRKRAWVAGCSRTQPRIQANAQFETLSLRFPFPSNGTASFSNTPVRDSL